MLSHVIKIIQLVLQSIKDKSSHEDYKHLDNITNAYFLSK